MEATVSITAVLMTDIRPGSGWWPAAFARQHIGVMDRGNGQ
jgi:hypothetical protein